MSGSESAPHLLVPASLVPVTSQIGLVVGHDDEVEGARTDDRLTTGAQVLLACRIGLHRGDGHPEKIAHASTAKMATSATTMATSSAVLFSCSRNGLKPMTAR